MKYYLTAVIIILAFTFITINKPSESAIEEAEGELLLECEDHCESAEAVMTYLDSSNPGYYCRCLGGDKYPLYMY